jgi:hypothetical protein
MLGNLNVIGAVVDLGIGEVGSRNGDIYAIGFLSLICTSHMGGGSVA